MCIKLYLSYYLEILAYDTDRVFTKIYRICADFADLLSNYKKLDSPYLDPSLTLLQYDFFTVFNLSF